jgi:drug/metabolite transporter superfamily protein YnfA
MSDSKPRNGLVMMITGGLMLLASVLYLLLVDDSFPMWLIIGGAGVMFIGVGSAIQNQHPGGTTL